MRKFFQSRVEEVCYHFHPQLDLELFIEYFLLSCTLTIRSLMNEDVPSFISVVGAEESAEGGFERVPIWRSNDESENYCSSESTRGYSSSYGYEVRLFLLLLVQYRSCFQFDRKSILCSASGVRG